MRRPQEQTLVHRLREPRRFIQVIAGPRQVGKTTIAQAVAADSGLPYVYASADGPSRGVSAFKQQFPRARTLLVGAGSGAMAIEAFLMHPASRWLA